jgi:zinc finger SWIM domain-containing protein 3
LLAKLGWQLFWAEAKMIVDYVFFGYMMTFDTKYDTNKELRPLAVFIGLNHHCDFLGCTSI